MADKRISQLIERTDIANNDVLPIVASGATTTNKVTISTIQDWMQDNLDVGVTSVGITLGTTGTDVNVSGSPITTSGNITINIPDASTSARGVVTTGTQTFAGNKSFQNTIFVNAGLRLDQNGTALPTFVQNISGTGLISSGSNGLGFNSANNLYFSGSEKGGAVLAVNNSAVRTYTLQDANGTLAFTSDLTGYVTLGTAQTITAQKTFSTSGSSDTAIINHGSGSGIALNITKAGNGEGLRVAKTSGSGNAVTITGGTLSAEAGQFSGDLQTSTRISATSGSNAITITPNVGGTQNRIETTGTLPLSLVSAAAITMAAGGTTPQITLATTGAVTLTGALNGTSATLTGALNGTSATFTAVGMGVNVIGVSGNPAYYVTDQSVYNSGKRWRFGYTGAIGGFSSFDFYNETDNLTALTLASTGAATFSSSVTANRYLINGSNGNSGQIIQQGDLFSTAATNLLLQSSSGNGIGFLTNGGTTFNMFINSSGNVGIGTASPAYALDVNGSTNVSSTNFYRYNGDTGIIGSGSAITGGSSTQLGIRAASDILFATNGATERMRITSSGELQLNTAFGNVSTIQTNSSNSVLVLVANSTLTDSVPRIELVGTTFASPSDTIFYRGATQIFTSSSASTERMRITSDGLVAVGAPTAARLSVRGFTNDSSGFAFETANSSGNTLFLVRNDGLVFIPPLISSFTTGSAANMFVSAGDGAIYRSTSSIKYKKNVEDYDKGLTEVMQMRPVFYEGISESDEGKIFAGLIAEEVHDLGLTEFVQYAEDGSPDSLAYQNMVALLIKAIQELKTEIDSLKTK
jgi:hypothetical protein